MEKLTRTIEINKITPIEVARLFCSMDNEQMATFFNAVADNVKREWTELFCFQMANVEPFLNSGGSEIVKTIGEYHIGLSKPTFEQRLQHPEIIGNLITEPEKSL